MLIAHGTSAEFLPQIARHGIRPRGGFNKSNWEIGSNPNNVYLSSAYAFYFANNACEDREHCRALIEILPPKLRENTLCADEDAIEQTMRKRPAQEPEKIRNWEIKRRTLYYRARAHLYSPIDSMQAMGTCAHVGTVPVEALGRVVIVPAELCFQFIIQVFDPLICVLNYSIMGDKHELFQRWLFGDEPTMQHRPEYGPANTMGVQQFPNINAALRERQNAKTSNVEA